MSDSDDEREVEVVEVAHAPVVDRVCGTMIRWGLRLMLGGVLLFGAGAAGEMVVTLLE